MASDSHNQCGQRGTADSRLTPLKRRWIIRILAIAVLLMLLGAQSVLASSASTEPTEPEPIDYSDIGIDITATHALVLETGRNTELFAAQAEASVHLPVLSKFMTALITLEQYAPDVLVTISETAFSVNEAAPEDAQIRIETGRKYPVDYLITAMLYRDSPAAAIALAEQVSGDETLFVELMNSRAELLQMSSTFFVSSSGTGRYTGGSDDGDQPTVTYSQTTLHDAQRLISYFLKNDSFKSVTNKAFRSSSSLFFLVDEETQGIDIATNSPYTWASVSNLTGVASGQFAGSGFTVATCNAYGFEILIILTNGDPDSQFADLQNIREVIYQNYTNTLLVSAGQTVQNTYMDSVEGQVFGLTYKRSVYYIRRAGSTITNNQTYVSNGPFDLPLYKGETVVGTMLFTFDNGLTLSVECTPDRTIYSVESSVLDRLLSLFENNPNLQTIIYLCGAAFALALVWNLIRGTGRLIWRVRLLNAERHTRPIPSSSPDANPEPDAPLSGDPENDRTS